MKIYSFAGFRYTNAVGDPGAQAAPPFDQIDDEAQERLHALSEHQFAHLTRPTGSDELEGARRSRELHAAWRAAGAVERDDAPCLYPYEITLQEGGSRLGLCALVDVRPESAGDLRPHELTVAKPLENRLSLLEETRIDYEPVFYLADDPNGDLERSLVADVSRLEPVVRHEDRERGESHLLYRLADPERIDHYRQLLETDGAAIADGHHRTKVAQLFAKKHDAEPGTAAAAKMAVLTSVRSRGLAIDPIHRVLQAEVDPGALRATAARVDATEARTGADMATAVAAAVSGADRPAVGVRFAGSSPEIWTLDPEAAPPDTPGREARLAAVLLHHVVLPAGGLPIESATDGRIGYRAKPDDAWRAVDDGVARAAFWLPPMSAERFARATAGGDVLPPKSTRFLPKLVSGLVWCGHDAAVR